MKRVALVGLTIVMAMIGSDVFGVMPAPTQEGTATPEGRQTPQRPEGRQRESVSAKPTPVALKDGVARLSPENTKVDFVGTHVGSEPNPRLGGFQKFKGTLTATDDGAGIQSLTMEFETGSLWTELGDPLSKHLKSADFLDVEKYPTAKFSSTRVKSGEKEGTLDVVGDFTLMDKTNEITIPLTMTKTDAGVLAKAEFKLDRATFGMDKMVERVSSEVAIKLSIGEKTTGGAAAVGQSGASTPGGRAGRGGRDPAAMFKNQDANGDGKLSGDEIPTFLQGRMEMFDTDGDKAITLEELKKGMQNRGGGRGPGGPDGKAPERGGDR